MAALVISWRVILFVKKDVIVVITDFKGSAIKCLACVTIGIISGLFFISLTICSGDILSGGGTFF